MASSQSWPEFKLKKKQTILATAFASEFCRMNILIREIALSSRFEPTRFTQPLWVIPAENGLNYAGITR